MAGERKIYILKDKNVEKLIKIARVLVKNGVDLSKIKLSKIVNGKQKRILLDEISQDGIDIKKIIEENNLDGKFRWGSRVNDLRTYYNGHGKYRLTEQMAKKVEEAGLIEKETIIKKVIKIGTILNENGVELHRVPMTRRINGKVKYILLKEISQKGIDMDKIIKENNLDPDFNWGICVMFIKRAYKGKEHVKMSEKEREEIDKLRINEKESASGELLRIAKILKENGIDLSRINTTKIVNGKEEDVLLKDIQQEEIDINKIIKENNLDENYHIGQKIASLRYACNEKAHSHKKGKRTYRITDKEIEEAMELGLLNKETVISQVIDIAKILDKSGIDLSKVRIYKTIDGKTEYILLQDIKQPGIDINKIIEENKLDGNFPFGRKVRYLRDSYRKNPSRKITSQNKEDAEKLGLLGKANKETSLEKKKNEKIKLIEKNKQAKQLYDEYKSYEEKTNNCEKTKH